MKKWLGIVALCLVASPAFGFQINAGISGSWFNDNKPGHGFAVEFTDNENGCEQIDGQGCLVVYWFAYDREGHPVFLLGVLPVDGNVAEGEMLYFSGQEFGSFTPPPTEARWGTLTLRFTDCNSGFANYESGFMPPDGGAAYDQSGQFKITRLAFVSNINCAKAERIKDMPVEAPSGFYLGTAFSRDFDDSSDAIRTRTIGAIIMDSGEAFLFFPGPATYRGQLAGDGLALTGQLKAMVAFGQELQNGEQTGTVEIKTGSAATLNVISEGRPGEGRAGDFLEGTFKGLGLEGDFQLKYQNSSNRPPDVSRGARCWAWSANTQSSAPSRIREDGSFNFELSGGCKVNGLIEPAGEPWNVFTATAELTDGEDDTCDFKGSYEGVASVVERSAGEPGNNKSFLFTLDNGTNVLAGFINSVADDGSGCQQGS